MKSTVKDGGGGGGGGGKGDYKGGNDFTEVTNLMITLKNSP